jgi:hypothetical protein
MLHWSIVTHAKARNDAQGFGSARNTRDASLDKRAKNAKAFLNERTKNNKRHSKTEYHGIRYRY